MRAIRLFIDALLAPGQDIALPKDASLHASRVLRLGAGDSVVLFNGDGHEYPARLAVGPRGCMGARITARESPVRESPIQATLVQALARGEKMDWIIQKATELGAVRIAPVVTTRSEVKLDAARRNKRRDHWSAVAVAACEQCGRNVLPSVDAPVELPAWLAANVSGPSQRWTVDPAAAARLRDVPHAPARPVVLAIGPEGGFAAVDLAVLAKHGFERLSLGPRVLRTETAGIAALASLQALYGDL